jgi:alkanesulfonate monooxygenase SsuD/methylene tetrahydromethanopterin reductase-like flavin-dependent oxidoreductase (luciferase family)
VRFGAAYWIQRTDWPALRDACLAAERAGFDSLWLDDHLLADEGDWHDGKLEGWASLAALAPLTTTARLGLLVAANTFRNPGLTAKLATTLDHISGGRAILGIGGAWFETEHQAYGLAFGDGFPERLRWLGEALPIMRGMLHGERPSASGPRYRAKEVRNDPPPLQERLPILIGGGGEQVTLKLVARYGDANNVGGGIENVRRKEAVLLQHCETVGRDPSEIERTAGLGTVIIRDSREEALRVQREIFERNGRAELWEDQPVGTVEDIAERLAPFIELGYRHLIAGFPAPYDEESQTRLITEVKPLLERG